MAIVQSSKLKVQPFIDYRELNQYIEAYTANVDVCASKLQKWHQKGSNMSLLDLRKAYLLVRGQRNFVAISDGGVTWQKVV